MFLNKENFKQITKNAPLVSIDFLIENDKNEFLLGKRNNSPASGFWFVPGGRVLKDESLSRCFARLSKVEFGREAQLVSSRFIGVFEHFYANSMYDENISTHYIVLAYHLKLEAYSLGLPLGAQHSNYMWLSKDEVLKNDMCHEYSKHYFHKF